VGHYFEVGKRKVHVCSQPMVINISKYPPSALCCMQPKYKRILNLFLLLYLVYNKIWLILVVDDLHV